MQRNHQTEVHVNVETGIHGKLLVKKVYKDDIELKLNTFPGIDFIS